MSACQISVVMPCLNEERTVALCVAKAVNSIGMIGVPGEVLVADNGSTDNSARLAAQAGARVVQCNVRGYGAAVRYGVGQSRGEYIVVGDADDSYDFSLIEPFISSLRDGADLVLGNRFRGGIEDGAMPCLNRYIGNPALTQLLNLLFRCRVGDAECGLRGFSRHAFERMHLRCDGMEFASEMVAKAARLGLTIKEIPIRYYRDGRNARPHLRPWRDGLRNVRFMLQFYLNGS